MAARTAATTAACAIALLLLLCVPLVDAHASRVPGTELPRAGAQLTTLPAEVAVTVSEPLDPDGSLLRVKRSDGVRIDVGPTTIENAATNTPRMRIALDPNAGPGAYTVTIQTLSTADGHPWTETFGFAVGDFAAPESSAPRDDVPLDAAAGRLLAFAGLSLAFGAALWMAWMPGSGATWSKRFVHEALLAAGLLHTAGLVVLILSTANASGLDLRTFAFTDVGRIQATRLILGIGAFVLAGLSLIPATRTRTGPVFGAGLLMAAGLASSRLGHASLAGLSGVAVDYLHLVPAATWLGGLAILLWVLRNESGHLTAQDVRRMGLRFGTAALACVLLLTMAGVATTLVIVGLEVLRSPGTLFAGPWGKFLAAKVGLMVATLAVASVNRYVFLEPATVFGWRGHLQRKAHALWSGMRNVETAGETRSFRRVLWIEACFGVAILALAGALTSVSPPTVATEGEDLHLQALGTDHRATLDLSPMPALGGRSAARFVVTTLAGEPVAEDSCGRTGCLDVTVHSDAEPESGQRYVLEPDADGAWIAKDVLWTLPGNVTLALRIQTADVFEDTLTFRVRVA